jgi:dephospho-CoA kinase
VPEPQFVFGYASLAADLDGVLAELRGYRRVWGVAMDNSIDLPGYKHYLLRSDGSRPHVHVAFMDLIENAGCAVNGVVQPVSEAMLRELDRRERNYDRIDLTDATEGASGTVWAYVGSPAGRARLHTARARGEAVLSRDYLADVRAGFAALGPQQLAGFERSSDLEGLPVWDLQRIDGALSHAEALAAGQSPDVVGQADIEQHQHEHEADDPGALHDAEGDRLAADLLGDRPEDVAAVKRQERKQVDDRQRQ